MLQQYRLVCSGMCLPKEGCDCYSSRDWFVMVSVFLKRGVTVIAVEISL